VRNVVYFCNNVLKHLRADQAQHIYVHESGHELTLQMSSIEHVNIPYKKVSKFVLQNGKECYRDTSGINNWQCPQNIRTYYINLYMDSAN